MNHDQVTFLPYVFSSLFCHFFCMVTNNSLRYHFLSISLWNSSFLGYKEETRIKDFWDDGDDKVVFRKNFTDRDYFCDKFWREDLSVLLTWPMYTNEDQLLFSRPALVFLSIYGFFKKFWGLHPVLLSLSPLLYYTVISAYTLWRWSVCLFLPLASFQSNPA